MQVVQLGPKITTQIVSNSYHCSGLIISYGAVQRDGQRSGSSSDFGLSGFLRRTVEDTIESHEIHILSALRHHEHKYDDKVEMIGTLNFHMSTV